MSDETTELIEIIRDASTPGDAAKTIQAKGYRRVPSRTDWSKLLAPLIPVVLHPGTGDEVHRAFLDFMRAATGDVARREQLENSTTETDPAA